jgi:cell division protein FtsB
MSPRRNTGPPVDDAEEGNPSVTSADTDDAGTAVDGESAFGPDLAGLTVAGLTRRRVAFLAAIFVSAWIVILFARQVGGAADAKRHLHELDEGNAALTGQVASLQRELELIQRQTYVQQAARAYGLGKGREIAFTLSPGAAPLPANAPGSAAVRLGASDESQSPLESWLSLLFGPSR